MRYFNGKKIELLAPAGNFEIFKSILETGCDAIYFGGQRMNMRLIRKGFNFTDEELREAVQLAKAKGKATYITLNNLLEEDELDDLKAYLRLLEDIGPTGIIVQDLAVVKAVRELGLKLEVHASVMMNIHNLHMIKTLEAYDVKRVVLSRETTLAEAAVFHANTDIELEYFTHGDMCVTHGAQCYYSSMLFGMSSNRGKCLKPCRWWFDQEDGAQHFPLAVKDMSMITHLPEMIQAGITSFKIEGRMREAEFITSLIEQYAAVLDRYIADPMGYETQDAEAWVYENRKRDLSTAYAFGNPGVANINTRYEGTGKFYSTGRMFSTPTKEHGIQAEQTEKILNQLEHITSKSQSSASTQISVRVDDLAGARAAIQAGADRVYLSLDVFEPKRKFTLEDVRSVIKEKGHSEIFLGMPRMMDDLQMENLKAWVERLPELDGLLVTHLGGIHAFKNKGLKLIGDFSLNIFNHEAAEFYREAGLDAVTASIEMTATQLAQFVDRTEAVELIAFGNLTTMYMSHDLYKAHDLSDGRDLILKNEAGAYLVKRDVFGKCHLISQLKLNLAAVLHKLPVSSVRIEGALESPESLAQKIRQFKEVIASGSTPSISPLDVDNTPELYTYGSLIF